MGTLGRRSLHNSDGEQLVTSALADLGLPGERSDHPGVLLVLVASQASAVTPLPYTVTTPKG